jgi:TonB family protein
VNNEIQHSDYHLTAKEMGDYLSGNLSDAEMHGIEKHLLECDFCAEAMEGVETLDDPSAFEQDVSKLKKQVDKRVQKPGKKTKIVPFYQKVLRIAAMLAVLIVASVLVNNYFKSDVTQKEFSEKKKTEKPKEKDSQIEKKEINLNQDSIIKSNNNQTKKEENKDKEPEVVLTKTSIAEKVNPAENNKQVKTDRTVIAPETVVMEEEVILDEEVYSSVIEITEDDEFDVELMEIEEELVMGTPAEDQPIPARKQNLSMRSAADNQSNVAAIPPLRKIAGRVLTEDDTPLPFVSILVKDSDAGTFTNEKGEFMLNLPEGNQTLIVSSVGYETEEIKVAGQDTLSIIYLGNGIALNEMSITVSGVSNQKKSESNIKSRKPEPLNSKAYQNYIKDNLHYPEEALETKIKGVVILQFTVKPNGEISQIIVIKGLGYGCDQEAIRLLEEGPKWVPGSKDGEPIEMKTEFKVKFKPL